MDAQQRAWTVCRISCVQRALVCGCHSEMFNEDTYFSKLKGLKASPDFSLDISQIGRNEIKMSLEPAKAIWVDI